MILTLPVAVLDHSALGLVAGVLLGHSDYTIHVDYEQGQGTIDLSGPNPDDPDEGTYEVGRVLPYLDRLDPQRMYVLIDGESPQTPYDYVTAAASWPTAEELEDWSGEEPNSMGYGGVKLVTSPFGPSLYWYAGGSHLASALGFWLMPLPSVEELTASG